MLPDLKETSLKTIFHVPGNHVPTVSFFVYAPFLPSQASFLYLEKPIWVPKPIAGDFLYKFGWTLFLSKKQEKHLN